MTRDDIIRMAKQASGSEWSIFQDFMPELERFAALVAAAEREACALACEGIAMDDKRQDSAVRYCAAVIRARSVLNNES